MSKGGNQKAADDRVANFWAGNAIKLFVSEALGSIIKSTIQLRRGPGQSIVAGSEGTIMQQPKTMSALILVLLMLCIGLSVYASRSKRKTHASPQPVLTCPNGVPVSHYTGPGQPTGRIEDLCPKHP